MRKQPTTQTHCVLCVVLHHACIPPLICSEMVYVDAQGVEWPSAPQGMHEDTAHAEADASPFGTPSSTDTSPLGGLQPPTQERLAPPRDHDLEPAPRGGSGSGSGSGRRASQRHMGAGLATVEEHRAAAGYVECTVVCALSIVWHGWQTCD